VHTSDPRRHLPPSDPYDMLTQQTLTSSHLDFAIHTILLNPTKRLLAVIGRNRLVVVILPKSGWSSGGGEIRCRSIEIDRFTFSPSSPTAITKVVWHPLGEGGQSLWVLTADGILRCVLILISTSRCLHYNLETKMARLAKLSGNMTYITQPSPPSDSHSHPKPKHPNSPPSILSRNTPLHSPFPPPPKPAGASSPRTS
jgi:hypothetical protein